MKSCPFCELWLLCDAVPDWLPDWPLLEATPELLLVVLFEFC